MIAVNAGVKESEVDRVQHIVIVGGGAAGWLAAATLARLLKPNFCQIRVVGSQRPTASGCSEVALPSFHRLNGLLGINEDDLLQKTRGTFRLGQRFTDWGVLGNRYFHAFGSLGAKLEAVPFHHYWLKLRGMGDGAAIEEYSTAAVAAKRGRFAPPLDDRRSVLSLYSYGYHFHAASLAAYLREYAEAHGVIGIDRGIVDVQMRSEDGFIDALLLEDGSQVRADLYIDCGGPSSLLSQRALHGAYEDWSRWLPCDRWVAVLSAGTSELPPYSESIAGRAGWRRSVPLQHCVDNGFAYSSRYLSDDEAAATMLADLPGAALSEPQLLRLTPGRPVEFWTKNCISLVGGMPEPLESTELHLVQTGITRLVTLFPVTRFSPCDIEEYNRQTSIEHDRIRDFLILHYKSTQRSDSPFWENCREMEVPPTLRVKIELFRQCGRIGMLDEEHFGEESWLALLLGQQVGAQTYDPLADVLEIADVRAALSRMRSMIEDAVGTLPTHANYVEQHCAAAPAWSGA
jgi:tryptophan halogenase